jgi:hypothetical protein
MRTALKSGLISPLAGVRRVICRQSFSMTTSCSRSRSRNTSPHSWCWPASRHRASVNAGRIRVLPHFPCWLSSGGMKDAGAEQFEAGAAVHSALDHLDPANLAFDGAGGLFRQPKHCRTAAAGGFGQMGRLAPPRRFHQRSVTRSSLRLLEDQALHVEQSQAYRLQEGQRLLQHPWGLRAAYSGGRAAGFGPVDHQLALGKKPGSVLLSESIQVADRRDHQGSIIAIDGQVVGDAVTFTLRRAPFDFYCTLAVQVGRGLVGRC